MGLGVWSRSLRHVSLRRQLDRRSSGPFPTVFPVTGDAPAIGELPTCHISGTTISPSLA